MQQWRRQPVYTASGLPGAQLPAEKYCSWYMHLQLWAAGWAVEEHREQNVWGKTYGACVYALYMSPGQAGTQSKADS